MFIKYIELANQSKLPLIIHCREAFSDLFNILESHPLEKRGILHCFTGSLDEALKATKKGFFISFSGILTFPKSQDLRAVAEKIPLENLLIETDAPYLAPQSKRGKKNEPCYILETMSCLAKVKKISEEEIKKQLQINSETAFQLIN